MEINLAVRFILINSVKEKIHNFSSLHYKKERSVKRCERGEKYFSLFVDYVPLKASSSAFLCRSHQREENVSEKRFALK